MEQANVDLPAKDGYWKRSAAIWRGDQDQGCRGGALAS